jgi:hypothetical protein
MKKKHIVQARLSEDEKVKFEEIRSIIEFEKIQGNCITPNHHHSKENRVTDTDIIRLLIKRFTFSD